MATYYAQVYDAFKAAIENADHVLGERLPGETELDHAKRIQAAFERLANYVQDMHEGISSDTATMIRTLDEMATVAQAPKPAGGSFFARVREKGQANQRDEALRESLQGVHDSLGETIYACRERLNALPKQ